MSDSLKDQLMKLGFQPKPDPQRDEQRSGKPARARGGERGQAGRAGERPQGARGGRDGSPSAPGGQRHGRPQSTPGDQRRSGADAPKRGARRGGAGGARSGEEMDLARAYALRQRQEQAERVREEQARQEEARQRREARQKLAQLLEDKAQNHADAELARHFEFGGKIRRVHVTEPQFKAINAGELGVVQLAGRYLLVDAAVAREAAALLPSSLALLVDPSATEGGNEYSDPRYVVPDDLVW